MILDIYIAMEESYKNGYLKGVEDTKREFEMNERKGYWIQKNGVTFCSVCQVCGSIHWKRCPVCEAKMEMTTWAVK